MEASMEVIEVSIGDIWQLLPWKLPRGFPRGNPWKEASMDGSLHGSFISNRYDLHPVCGTPALTTTLARGRLATVDGYG